MNAVPNLIKMEDNTLYYQMIDLHTCTMLWSERPEEQAIIEEKKRIALLQKVVERLNISLCCTEGCDALDKKYRDLILETKIDK